MVLHKFTDNVLWESPNRSLLGVCRLSVFSLIYVSEDQGFFGANGLNVTLRDYDTSEASGINGMENDEVDISLSPESAIVREVLKGKISAVIRKYR